MANHRNLTTCLFTVSITVSMLLSASAQVFAAKRPLSLVPLSAQELKMHLIKPNTKASIVAFWATWCQPCLREVPDLIKIQEAQKKNGVQVLLVASDPDNDLDEASSFLAKYKVKFPTYHISEPIDVFMKEFVSDWPTVIPTTLLFNKKGTLEEKWYGRIRMEMLHRRLKQVLNKPPKGPVATKGKVGSH